MKISSFFNLAAFGLKTIVFKQKKPILGTIILTDYCNLTCKHCAVNNINKKMVSFHDAIVEMEAFYKEGIRILFFCGGETMMWKDGSNTVRDLIKIAREIGFLLVNVVTNGTLSLDIPEADVVFLSLDGTEKTHNKIRGNTYSAIMKNVAAARNSNICVYMAVNNLNYDEVIDVTTMVKENKNLNSISFNLHTPYEGTTDLTLTREQKESVINDIKTMIDNKFPVFNLKSALNHYMKNNWERPCYQCVVSEDNKRFVCGRCVEIDGLCDECGYLFAVEFSLLFKGHIPVIWDMMKTYLRFV